MAKQRTSLTDEGELELQRGNTDTEARGVSTQHVLGYHGVGDASTDPESLNAMMKMLIAMNKANRQENKVSMQEINQKLVENESNMQNINQKFEKTSIENKASMQEINQKFEKTSIENKANMLELKNELNHRLDLNIETMNKNITALTRRTDNQYEQVDKRIDIIEIENRQTNERLTTRVSEHEKATQGQLNGLHVTLGEVDRTTMRQTEAIRQRVDDVRSELHAHVALNRQIKIEQETQIQETRELCESRQNDAIEKAKTEIHAYIEATAMGNHIVMPRDHTLDIGLGDRIKNAGITFSGGGKGLNPIDFLEKFRIRCDVYKTRREDRLAPIIQCLEGGAKEWLAEQDFRDFTAFEKGFKTRFWNCTTQSNVVTQIYNGTCPPHESLAHYIKKLWEQAKHLAMPIEPEQIKKYLIRQLPEHVQSMVYSRADDMNQILHILFEIEQEYDERQHSQRNADRRRDYNTPQHYTSYSQDYKHDDRNRDRWTDRKNDKWTGRSNDRWTDRNHDRWTDRNHDRRTDRNYDRQYDRNYDRRYDNHNERQNDRADNRQYNRDEHGRKDGAGGRQNNTQYSRQKENEGGRENERQNNTQGNESR